MLVDQGAGVKTRQGKRLGQGMGTLVGQGVGKDIARARRGLEAARAPAAVKVQPVHRGFTDDRAGIRADIDNAAPLPVHAHPAESREQFADGLQGVFDHRKRTALAVTVVAVHARADHQIALVRLADIAVHGIGHDHGIQTGLQRLRDQSLQGAGLHRQAQAGHFGHHPGIARGDAADFFGGDKTAAGFHPRYRIIGAANTGHFGLLNQIDAQRIGAPGVAPGHGIVPRRAAARLPGRPQHRIARRRAAIQQGSDVRNPGRVHHLAVNT